MNKDRFSDLIRSALQDEAAECRLPEDFSERVLRNVRIPRNEGRENLRFPRWAKVAAAIVAMASFASFAAWVGVAVYEAAHETDVVAAEEPKDPETEIISNQGENTMIARKMATLVGAAMVSFAVPAETIESEPTFVFLRPETSSFWNTATNNTMTVPIDYPVGATRASLSVSGIGYAREYAGLTGPDFTFELPAPTSPDTENVYDLALTFDDGTVRRAKLGLIEGLSPDSEGTTRCLAPAQGAVWNTLDKRAVLPIPYGTTSFTVNGVETDTGLDGAQGWYALRGRSGETYSLSLVAGGVNYLASLVGYGNGLILIFK